MKELFALNFIEDRDKEILSCFLREKFIAQDENEFVETMNVLFFLKNYEDRQINRLHYSGVVDIYEEVVFPDLPKELKLLYINNYLFCFFNKKDSLEIDIYFSFSEIKELMNTGTKKYNERNLFSNKFILDNIHKKDFIDLFEEDGKINVKRFKKEFSNLKKTPDKLDNIGIFLRRIFRRFIKEESLGEVFDWYFKFDDFREFVRFLEKDMFRVLRGDWKTGNFERIVAGSIVFNSSAYFRNGDLYKNVEALFSLLDGKEIELYLSSSIVSDVLSRKSYIGIEFVKDEFVVVFLFRRYLKDSVSQIENRKLLSTCERKLNQIFSLKGMNKKEVAENVEKFMVLLWV